MRSRDVVTLLFWTCGSTIFAELPAELPGEEVTQEYMRWVLPKDTVLTTADSKTPIAVPWYDKAAKTWDAPPLSEQMSSDRTNMPLGTGGIFVPRFSELYRTPDIEILDANGEVLQTGSPGKTYPVEPGTYFVVLGSGSHRQRIVRQVVVEESKATPVLPDWCGLTIETLDSNSVPFRGEYEIVRIDEFEPYGRGFGADPTTGEVLTTWVLKPGIYKIFGRGQSFNTLKNFVTVRLLPGEYTKFLLIQRPDDFTIMGGGTIDLTAGTKLKSHWRYGSNIGGTLNFSGTSENTDKKYNTMNLTLDLRTNLWLTFNNNPFEWTSSLLLDEGINVSDLDFFTRLDFKELINSTDQLRMNSLFIWRVLPWFGPYGRTEIKTNLFPGRIKRSENSIFYIMETDSALATDVWDSSSTYKIKNSFSPFSFEVSGGTNFDAIRMRAFDTKVRLGFASSMRNFPPRSDPKKFSDIKYDENDTVLIQALKNASILQEFDKTFDFAFGPQASLTTNLHIGRFAVAFAELKIFTPVYPELRWRRPDFDLLTTLSWRISRYVTLDYDFQYILKQPYDIKVRENESTHRIWLRFSYSSR